MEKNKQIPIVKLSQIVKDIDDYNWGFEDYYISSDNIIYKPKNKKPFQPNFYALILGIEGWIDIKVNNEVIRIDKNIFFAAGPNHTVQIIAKSEDCKIRTVLFTKDFLVNNSNNYFFLESFNHFSVHFQNYIRLKDEDVGKILTLYDTLLTRRDKINSNLHIEVVRSLIISYVFESAIIFYKELKIDALQVHNRNTAFTENFKKMVFENCLKERNLQFYADALFVSPKHLIKIIKTTTGKAPGYFINDAIAAIAKVQLKKNKLSISEIANSFPFADLQSFSKFFKRQVGISPMQYRYQSGLKNILD
ncbi:MAG: helix-turn-helix domain-containing protein [Chryseobacterium sp.]|jgi:AraC-like DNA-binding protein|uniref:helix-turn-helix domain-containing protein n=1 Tax=Chryseobacterium sp. TaxID=1871047 RepID=UPI00283751BF|nr:helix-turn-helix domain-containing protein [Chryseobacterium sp.]MDR2236855.1 helix-turn-helix domain-containing protein [Chryseobacterium sp.]